MTTPDLPDTIGALGKELVMRGEMLDAFGDTYDDAEGCPFGG
jgi:hypothetical protein